MGYNTVAFGFMRRAQDIHDPVALREIELSSLDLCRSIFHQEFYMAFSRRGACTVLASAAFVVMTAGCSTVTSNTSTLTASLTPDQENPATSSVGKGTAKVWYNKDTNGLRWEVEYSGLTGPATAGHFHGPAAPGANAGVVVPFKSPLEYPVIKGEAVITPAQGEQLLAGLWYINLHTQKYPGGEIRGQVMLKR